MHVCPWRGPYRVFLYDHELTCKVVIGFQGISYACRSLVRTISLQNLCESFQKWKLYYLVMNTRRKIHHTLVPWLLWLARPVPWSCGEYTNLFIKKTKTCILSRWLIQTVIFMFVHSWVVNNTQADHYLFNKLWPTIRMECLL